MNDPFDFDALQTLDDEEEVGFVLSQGMIESSRNMLPIPHWSFDHKDRDMFSNDEAPQQSLNEENSILHSETMKESEEYKEYSPNSRREGEEMFNFYLLHLREKEEKEEEAFRLEKMISEQEFSLNASSHFEKSGIQNNEEEEEKNE